MGLFGIKICPAPSGLPDVLDGDRNKLKSCGLENESYIVSVTTFLSYNYIKNIKQSLMVSFIPNETKIQICGIKNVLVKMYSIINFPVIVNGASI